MEKIKIDSGWTFKRQAPSVMSVMMPGGDVVNFPHDATIGTDVNPNSPNGNSTGWYDGCFANYNKHYTFPKEWENKKVYIQLDGSFWCTEISLNGHLIDMHPSGYAPYYTDITDQINFGEDNRINLFVNNSQQRTGRWYSGTGVYRHVYLRVAEKLHLSLNPTFIHTKAIQKDIAFLSAEAGIVNETNEDKEVNVKIVLYEDQGRNNPLGKAVVSANTNLTVKRNNQASAKLEFSLRDVKLWDIEHPNLYVVKTEVYCDGKLMDSDQSLCGVRMIEISRNNGLTLNGNKLKLKGGCIHSDNGILGAVSLYDAEYRKAKIHKDAGYNAFRLAHNPASEDFLEACDRLGMLVLDELFDVWRMLKDPNDYHLFFDAWWKKDAELSIMRDRIHPSVFMYSIGNEIGERNGLKGGYELSREISAYVRTLDQTRPLNLSLPTTFNGLNDKDNALMMQSLYQKLQGGEKIQNLTTEFSERIFNEKTAPFAEPVDVVGYNYLENRFEEDMKVFPQRIFIPSESHPDKLGFIWNLVEKYDCILGDFVWTSMDYIGEAAIGVCVYTPKEEHKSYSRLNAPRMGYPWRCANCGDFDITGNPRNQLQYRSCVWGSEETYLEILHPDKYDMDVYLSQYGWDDAYNSWNFNGFEGKPTIAKIYSRAEEVELFINGKSLGKKPCGKVNDYRASYEVIYDKGEITAISYTKGKEVSRKTYKNVGTPNKLVTSVDKTELLADGESLAFISAYIADKEGNPVPHVEMKCQAKVEGEITLAGFGSGNPCTEENYTKGEFATYKGKILAVVRSTLNHGDGKLTIQCGDFQAETIPFKIN